MAEIGQGTVVQLKSGGPKMTCDSEPDRNGVVRCQWFDGGKLEVGLFALNYLLKPPPLAVRPV
jgi:uncharacterized protein YodC (DUF2158 family)